MIPGFAPLTVSGMITGVSDGRFVIRGAFGAGEGSSLGPTVVLLVGGRLCILITGKPSFTHDPTAFASRSIDDAAQDFVAVKSEIRTSLQASS